MPLSLSRGFPVSQRTTSLVDSASKLSSVENLNGSLAKAAIQSQVNTGLQKAAMVNKDMQTDVTSQSDESNGQEHHLKHIPSPTFVTMGGHLEPNSPDGTCWPLNCFDFTSIYRSTVWRDVCFLWSSSYGTSIIWNATRQNAFAP
ncbi:hypothetical protein OIU84_008828 [Salix udensis]|uniref:Uncharacterized protein n=1 Tax=Salix udensis TaxID=889485 RepID=A0AAD6JS33_9ROSI|nr:hypothetical protein OIU84_008828 [Salix udensis]